MSAPVKKHLITSIFLLGRIGSALAVSFRGIPEAGPPTFNFDELSQPEGSFVEDRL